MTLFYGIISLVVATAFLVWVNERIPSGIQKFAKVVGWVAVVLSAAMLLHKAYFFSTSCMKGDCGYGKGMHKMMMKGDGMMGGMGMGRMPPPPPPPSPAGN
ncbi:MAG: hypothetical protein ABIE74_10335 [Pseudomonadota bacterium]